MKHEEWNQKYMDCITEMRELKRGVTVKFGIPPFQHEEGFKVFSEIRIWLDVEHGMNPGFKVAVFNLGSFTDPMVQSEMGEKEMLALSKAQQALSDWRHADGDFPTAKSLELLEPNPSAISYYSYDDSPPKSE